VDNWPSTPAVPALLRVNGLKSGIYVATVTLLKTGSNGLIQTVLGCGIYTPTGAIGIVSCGNHSFSNPSMTRSIADIDTAWGSDPNQIPDLPFGKDYYACYRIGDTCKIVFFVGSPNATMLNVEPQQAPSKININFRFISDRESGQRLTGYVPHAQGSNSGVTVATGVDIGQCDQNQINGWNIPATLKAKLLPYVKPLTGQSAQDLLDHQPLTITKDEADVLVFS